MQQWHSADSQHYSRWRIVDLVIAGLCAVTVYTSRQTVKYTRHLIVSLWSVSLLWDKNSSSVRYYCRAFNKKFFQPVWTWSHPPLAVQWLSYSVQVRSKCSPAAEYVRPTSPIYSLISYLFKWLLEDQNSFHISEEERKSNYRKHWNHKQHPLLLFFGGGEGGYGTQAAVSFYAHTHAYCGARCQHPRVAGNRE